MKTIQGIDLDVGEKLICPLPSVDDNREVYLLT